MQTTLSPHKKRELLSKVFKGELSKEEMEEFLNNNQDFSKWTDEELSKEAERLAKESKDLALQTKINKH